MIVSINTPFFSTTNLIVRLARELFANHPKIKTILDTLMDVGLGYIKLGQAATTLY
jgi:excinuclease ABC subunit A